MSGGGRLAESGGDDSSLLLQSLSRSRTAGSRATFLEVESFPGDADSLVLFPALHTDSLGSSMVTKAPDGTRGVWSGVAKQRSAVLPSAQHRGSRHDVWFIKKITGGYIYIKYSEKEAVKVNTVVPQDTKLIGSRVAFVS